MRGGFVLEKSGQPAEWRIAGEIWTPHVTIAVAIRYLTKLRNETSNAVIKANAQKSIAALSRVR